MRKMEITEIDSGCYRIETTDFQDSDSVVYSWDTVSQTFYGEYQMSTMEKRRFQRDTFPFKDYPTIGEAINFIWKRDQEIYEERWKARIARNNRSFSSNAGLRVLDRIIV